MIDRKATLVELGRAGATDAHQHYFSCRQSPNVFNNVRFNTIVLEYGGLGHVYRTGRVPQDANCRRDGGFSK
jgi:hypothetical protein